jgi:hypothetical protein
LPVNGNGDSLHSVVSQYEFAPLIKKTSTPINRSDNPRTMRSKLPSFQTMAKSAASSHHHVIKIARCIAIVFSLLVMVPTQAQEPIPVGIVDFTSSVGTTWNKRLPELLVDQMVNSGLFDVLERSKLDSVVNEVEFQAGALVDPNKAVQVGGMSGARLLVTGNILENTATKTNSSAYNIKSTVYRYYLKARVEVIDLESGSKIFSHIADSSAELKKIGLNSTGRGEESLGPDVAEQLMTAMSNSQRIQALTGATDGDTPVNITITSMPQGADVEIDGVYYGNAGSTFETTPGVHEILVSLPGYELWKKKVKVSDGMTFQANLSEAVDAKIDIKVEQ